MCVTVEYLTCVAVTGGLVVVVVVGWILVLEARKGANSRAKCENDPPQVFGRRKESSALIFLVPPEESGTLDAHVRRP